MSFAYDKIPLYQHPCGRALRTLQKIFKKEFHFTYNNKWQNQSRLLNIIYVYYVLLALTFTRFKPEKMHHPIAVILPSYSILSCIVYLWQPPLHTLNDSLINWGLGIEFKSELIKNPNRSQHIPIFFQSLYIQVVTLTSAKG